MSNIRTPFRFPSGQILLGRLVGANFNSTADQAITLSYNGVCRIQQILVTNASISLTTAAGGIYTAASKGGSAIVASSQAYSSLSTSAKILSATVAFGSSDQIAATTIYLSLTTPQGSAATADVFIIGQGLL